MPNRDARHFRPQISQGRGRPGAALVTGIVMFVAPAQVIPIWPWLLTPLTCRVVGAICCLGSAMLGVFADPRWITVRLMLQVEMIMIGLILIAAVRARGEFFTDRPLTWLMLGGFVAVLTGSAYLWRTQTGPDSEPLGNRPVTRTTTA